MTEFETEVLARLAEIERRISALEQESWRNRPLGPDPRHLEELQRDQNEMVKQILKEVKFGEDKPLPLLGEGI